MKIIKERLKQNKIIFQSYQLLRKYIRIFASYRFYGNKYLCPFCNHSFSTFLPEGLDIPVLRSKQVIGGGYRSNAICPRCYSGDRERLLYLFLKTQMSDIFSKQMRILHVAPEPNLSAFLRSYLTFEYITAELYGGSVDIQMDITNIQFCDNSFDLIICNHVLEHINDDRIAIRELYRVLKEGGFAILQVPISYLASGTIEDDSIQSPEDRERAFGQSDHVRIYGLDYTTRLTDCGFSVTSLECRTLFSEEEIEKYRLLADEKVFLCTK